MHLKKKKEQYVGVDAQSPVQEYAVGGELPRLWTCICIGQVVWYSFEKPLLVQCYKVMIPSLHEVEVQVQDDQGDNRWFTSDFEN